jgi:hypothetical protein
VRWPSPEMGCRTINNEKIDKKPTDQTTIPKEHNYSFFLVFQKGLSVRMKGLHIINSPPYADFVVSILKSIFKTKLVSRVRIYRFVT